jgi:hypothetical protein
MPTGNGTATTTEPVDDLTAAIAQQVLSSLRSPMPRAPSPMPAPQTWLQFATALDKLVAASPDLRHALEEAMARAVRRALVTGDAAAPSLDEFLSGLRGPEVLARGGTVVRAFWWGFHIQISHEDLMSFLGAAEPINTIIGAIGGSIPSPAAPFIAAAAAFVAGALGLLRGLDHGRGVYVSMSWFAPGIFVPTSV